MQLISKYPDTTKEFDATVNWGVDIADVSLGSTKPLHWACRVNAKHKWSASPNQRTSGGKLRGCPYCAGKKVLPTESFKATYPLIAIEWDQHNLYKSDEVTPKSNHKVQWKCRKDSSHLWTASPKQRTNGNSCPYCTSLRVKYPELASQWHSRLNEVNAVEVQSNSHKKVWWKCPRGFDHVWQASPNSRVSNNSGCPICSGHLVVPSNSLASVYPEIAAEWASGMNHPLEPKDVFNASIKKYYWQCNQHDEHKWMASVKSRVNGSGCPVCLGRKVVKSNSLEYIRPEIATLWHPTLNSPLTPKEVVEKSNKMIWWKCPEGPDHEWKAVISNVTSGSSCPVCMGRKITGTNNFATLHPDLLKEWDYKKNVLDPIKLSGGTKTKVWWICERNEEHQWFGLISDRTVKSSGCPFCAVKLNVSELKMLGIIKDILDDNEVLYRQKPSWLNRLELDVYIPDLQLAFEYQGRQHLEPVDFFGGKATYVSQVKRDKIKLDICNQRGVTLVYVYYYEKLNRELIEQKLKLAGIKYS